MYVPLAELTLTKNNYSLTLIDGLTMETLAMEALSLELGVWCMWETMSRSPCPQT